MSVTMTSTKNEILAHLDELEIEADENLTKAALLELIPESDEDDEVEETEAEPEAEAPPAPAIVGDDIVTTRGTPAGGVTRMPRSEYLAMQAKKDGKDED